MSSKLRRLSRQFHLWLALIIFIPVVIVIGSGLLLQVKKEFDWIQPPSTEGVATTPSISFEQILIAVQTLPEVQVNSWQDIDRLDVRPSKGIIKVLTTGNWEVQLDSSDAKVLQVAYRRSDTIEAIDDGSWFFDAAKLWIFLPVAIMLWIIWITGGVMLYTTLKSKYRKRQSQKLHNIK